MNPDLLLTTTLRNAPWGAEVTRILAAALDAVDPAVAVRRFLRCTDDTLYIGKQAYAWTDYERIFVVGTGKAGIPMAQAATAVLGKHLTSGIIVVKGYDSGATASMPFPAAWAAHLVIYEAGHPIPDARGIAGAQHIVDLLQQTTARDLVIALISGGGSALLTLPAPGISLDDMQALTAVLLRCGANINEMNTLRKHLDQIKGGGLVRLVHPASLATLVLSDVVGSPLDVIASGPSVPDPTTFADAYAVLEQYGVVDAVPASIINRLQHGIAGDIADTLKPGDPRFNQVQNIIVGSNSQAAEAAQQVASAAGFNTQILTTYLQAEARDAGRMLAAIAREIASNNRPLARPACMIVGGETTVTLRGNGSGGRNQELALAAVNELAGLPNIALITLATDGGDGPTDAAGAVVTGETLARAHALGLNPLAHLTNNDAYPFFDTLGDLLRPGPTETNVNDLALVFAF